MQSHPRPICCWYFVFSNNRTILATKLWFSQVYHWVGFELTIFSLVSSHKPLPRTLDKIYQTIETLFVKIQSVVLFTPFKSLSVSLYMAMCPFIYIPFLLQPEPKLTLIMFLFVCSDQFCWQPPTPTTTTTTTTTTHNWKAFLPRVQQIQFE